MLRTEDVSDDPLFGIVWQVKLAPDLFEHISLYQLARIPLVHQLPHPLKLSLILLLIPFQPLQRGSHHLARALVTPILNLCIHKLT